MKLVPVRKVRGEISVPTDKSITHRALIFAALAEGESTLYNLLRCLDTERTKDVLEKLGTKFEGDWTKMKVTPGVFRTPTEPLFCGNSGTTTRLMAGVIASHEIFAVLYGDDSLSRRPMARVMEPLGMMGAKFLARENNFLPMAIQGGRLKGIEYKSKVASAQVKSAVIIAGLRAEGKTTVEEPVKSRDHTERMLKKLGASIQEEGNRVTVWPSSIKGFTMEIPGDVSSASFFVALGVIHPNAKIVVRGVGLNETRIGFLRTLKLMGANVEWRVENEDVEPIGTIVAESSPNLRGIEVPVEMIPSMIDEVPLLALVGVFAEGETVVKGAEELRKKESDRIRVVVENFRRLGVTIEEFPDGFRVVGRQRIRGGVVDPEGDHRMAMMFSLAGLLSEEGVEVRDHECVSVSFPEFYGILEKVIA